MVGLLVRRRCEHARLLNLRYNIGAEEFVSWCELDVEDSWKSQFANEVWHGLHTQGTLSRNVAAYVNGQQYSKCQVAITGPIFEAYRKLPH